MRQQHNSKSRPTIAFYTSRVFCTLLITLFLLDVTTRTTTVVVHALSSIAPAGRPQGCAAKPLEKKKVAVLGVGGFLGGMTFGFLQRSSSLYGTGIGQVRAIAAVGDSAGRLNRILSKQFVLAFADETYIKLTDLADVDFIAQRLQGFDSLILGDELELQKRPVTGGSYDKTPNDKTYEVYWPTPAGTVSIVDEKEADTLSQVRKEILQNILQAAKQTGTIQHIVAVSSCDGDDDSFVSDLKACGIPYTCLHPTGEWARIKDYTFKSGVQTDLQVQAIADNEQVSSSSSSPQPIAMEDMAALCVQCLQSLDWSKSRHLSVSCQGPVSSSSMIQGATATTGNSGRPPKRPDQEWCVNSSVLAQGLQSIS